MNGIKKEKNLGNRKKSIFIRLWVKVDQFEVPVCNSFKAKFVVDQLCYEVDPNDYINNASKDTTKQLDLFLIIDYNEDRQFGAKRIKGCIK